MFTSDDPATMTPDERFDEVARSLDRGLLRSKNSPNLTANQTLEVSAHEGAVLVGDGVTLAA